MEDLQILILLLSGEGLELRCELRMLSWRLSNCLDRGMSTVEIVDVHLLLLLLLASLRVLHTP